MSIKLAYEDVLSFHIAAGVPYHFTPRLPPDEEFALRDNLLAEEREEYDEAIDSLEFAPKEYLDQHLAFVAKEIVDEIVILLGTAATLGLPMAEVWRRVHRSNMAKVRGGVRRRGDGKILKPDGWEPPDVLGAIRDSMEGR